MPGMPTVVLVLASALFSLGVLIALGLLMISPMMFDAPGSESSIYPWLIIGSLLLYPVLTLIGLPLAWRAHSRRDRRATRLRLLLPLLGVGLVVGSVALLQIVCAGKFACR